MKKKNNVKGVISKGNVNSKERKKKKKSEKNNKITNLGEVRHGFKKKEIDNKKKKRKLKDKP